MKFVVSEDAQKYQYVLKSDRNATAANDGLLFTSNKSFTFYPNGNEYVPDKIY